VVPPIAAADFRVNPVNSLRGLRIGCVRYLNSRPLIEGLSQVRLEHPSVLAAALRAGELDAALVPVFEVLRAPAGRYRLVDGVGICSDGPVYSVFVAHAAELRDVDAVVADPASLTSVHLMQVLWRRVLKRPLKVLAEEDSTPAQRDAARLLIGNQAIQHRIQSEQARPSLRFWDLGEAWSGWAGLPFVYAVWVLRGGMEPSVAAAAAEDFRSVAARGLLERDRIAAENGEFPEALAKRYLNESIRFHVGTREKRGLACFGSELASAGLLDAPASELQWV
jgi:chorismate dehydratase